MPRGARRSVAHARQQVVAAGDELLEGARGTGEELVDERELLAVDADETGGFRPLLCTDVGEAHASTLPGSARWGSLQAPDAVSSATPRLCA